MRNNYVLTLENIIIIFCNYVVAILVWIFFNIVR